MRPALRRLRDAMDRESCARGALYLGLAWLPSCRMHGWGRGFFEPKLTLLLLLGLSCLPALRRRLDRPEGLTLDATALALLGLLTLRVASLFYAPNTGLALQAVAAALAALLIGLFVAHAGLDAERVGLAALVSVALPLAGGLSMILWRHRAFGLSWGSWVGERNSLPVLLTQALPMVLLLAPRGQDRGASAARRALALGAPAAMGLAIYVALAYRTRSAWWMLAIYAACLPVLARQAGRQPWPRLARSAALAAGLALALLAAPTALRWQHRSPYLDSLRSMVSLARSSGRDKLWTVALRMVAARPLLGVGAGNYPALWREHIGRAARVDPRVFAFLRPDLPLFNDYLQCVVETGWLSLLLFAAFALAIPGLTFYRLSMKEERWPAPETLLCLLCLATSADAFFDYPFYRPETLLNYVVALALASRTAGGGPRLRVTGGGARLATTAAAVLLTAVIGCLSLSLGLRAAWDRTGEARLLAVAYGLWPWDANWGPAHARALARAGMPAAERRLVQGRLRDWPFNPESRLVEAQSLAREGRLDLALDAYRHAVVQVQGGRCFRKGYRGYKAFERGQFAAGSRLRLTPAELGACIEPANRDVGVVAVQGQALCGALGVKTPIYWIHDPSRMRVSFRRERRVFDIADRAFAEAAERSFAKLRLRLGIVGIEHLGLYNYRKVAGADALSAHANGLALDIASFEFQRGGRLIVRRDWKGPRAPALRAVLDLLREDFDTVLDPDHDAAHANHFHVELASARRDPGAQPPAAYRENAAFSPPEAGAPENYAELLSQGLIRPADPGGGCRSGLSLSRTKR